MANEKKLTIEQITDEQANEAAGGIASSYDFKCDNCGRFFSGALRFNVSDKFFCSDCFKRYQSQIGFSKVPHKRP